MGHYTGITMSAALQDAVLVDDDPVSTDAALVSRFVASRDAQAFTELVRRHSTLVLGVCRRVLRDADDIDDVFQATFLVLVRDPSRVRKRTSLASWLYGVAYRLALRVARHRQRRRETMLVDGSPCEITDRDTDTLTELADRYDRQLVDAELNALPERYRQPLVLRYLAGKPPREVAEELGLTIGAVEGLLKRGRDELRARLLRRGVTLGAALVAVQMIQQTAEAAPTEALINATVQSGLAWNGTNTSSLDPIPDRVLELSGKELATMTMFTKAGLAVGLTAGALALGLGGAGLLVGTPHGRADAGLVSTLQVSHSTERGLETTALAVDPDATVTSSPAPGAGRAGTAPAPGGPPGAFSGAGGSGDGSLSGSAGIAGTEAASPPTEAATWDFKPRSPSVVKIERALTQSTSMDFADTPIIEAIQFLSDRHSISILIDPAIKESGIELDQPLTMKIQDVALRSGMNLLLEPLKLDSVIKNEVLYITTREKAEELMETRVYNVSRIPHLTPKELVEIIAGGNGVLGVGGGIDGMATGGQRGGGLGGVPITKTVPGVAGEAAYGGGGGASQFMNASLIPNALWEERDGQGGTAWAGKNTLIIRQNQRVHHEIVELLNQLAQDQAAMQHMPLNSDRTVGGSDRTGFNPSVPSTTGASGFSSPGSGFGPAGVVP